MLTPTTYKLAMQVGRSDLDCLQAFATAVLRARPVYQEPGLAACQLPSGSLLELYGPGACYPAHLFARSPVVASFRVPDLAWALQQARAAGLRPVGGMEHVCTGLSYCHLALADGMIIGIYQESLAFSVVKPGQ